MTQTIEKTDIEIRDEIDPVTGEPRCSHIVAGDDKHTGIELVFEARVNGTPVTAFCGYTWVPMRDAKQYPICSKCKEIYEHTPAAGKGQRPEDIRS